MIVITECPPTEDGFERFACPTPDNEGRFRCIDDHVLCDGYIDCPNGDDEDRKNCFFFKTVSTKPLYYYCYYIYYYTNPIFIQIFINTILI